MKIMGNYRAKEQYDNHATWYPGIISKFYTDDSGNQLYDYKDGDFEEGMIRENLKLVEKSNQEKEDKRRKMGGKAPIK